MLETNRPGSTVEVVSMRVNVTDAAGASELSEMNTRPLPVATQSVPVLLGARSIAPTSPVPAAGTPARSPYDAAVRSVAPAGPMRTKSPHVGLAAEVVNSGQFASRKSRSPPQSWV